MLVPQWKNSSFYPDLLNLKSSSACRMVAVFDGRLMFRAGADPHTYFSEKFRGNVEVWELQF
jgi:hypothetical protein